MNSSDSQQTDNELMHSLGVLVVGNFLSASLGTRSVAEDLANYLKGQNFRITTTSSRLNVLHRIVDMVLTTYRSRQNYDIALIDTYNYRAFAWAEVVSYLLRRFHKPYILTLHAGLMPEFEQEQPERVRRLLTSAAAVTTPSIYIKQAMSRIRDDIIHLPNAIDLLKYPFRTRSRIEPNLVWLRAFEQTYQPQLAIKVLELTRHHYPRATLCLYGRDTGDGTFEECQALVAEKGLQNAVKMPGKVAKNEVPLVLGRHDIFLNTTRAESFGIGVMEAAALGLCIVTTNVGELPYIWKHEQTAMLVPSDNAEEMATSILQLLSDPVLARRLSTNARLVAEKHDWSAVLPRWIELIEQVLEDRGERGQK